MQWDNRFCLILHRKPPEKIAVDNKLLTLELLIILSLSFQNFWANFFVWRFFDFFNWHISFRTFFNLHTFQSLFPDSRSESVRKLSIQRWVKVLFVNEIFKRNTEWNNRSYQTTFQFHRKKNRCSQICTLPFCLCFSNANRCFLFHNWSLAKEEAALLSANC